MRKVRRNLIGWSPIRDYGTGGNVTVYGVATGAVGTYYSAGAPAVALGTVRVWLRLDSTPTTAFKIVAGDSTGALPGWLLAFEDQIGGADAGQLVLYANINGSLTATGRRFMAPGDVGKTFCVHIAQDGSRVRWYIDGRTAVMGASYATLPASASIYNFGGRNNGTFASDVTLIEIAQSSTTLTHSQIRADYALGVGAAMAGAVHQYTASASTAATWEDSVGSEDLTRYGSPTTSSFVPSYGRHVGSLNVWGDSIAAGRNNSGFDGDGWKRAVEQDASLVDGYAITMVGASPASMPTYDWNYWQNATGGEEINVRIATLATDLTNGFVTNDAATLFAYGINDIVVSARTSAQIQGDLATAIGYAQTARPNRPIFVTDILPADGLTVGEEAERDAFNSGFAAWVTGLQATYPRLRGIVVSDLVTDPADIAQLYDGTHPTPATYALMAERIRETVVPTMVLYND